MLNNFFILQPTYRLSGNFLSAQATPRGQPSYRQLVTFASQQLAQIIQGYDTPLAAGGPTFYFCRTPSGVNNSSQSLQTAFSTIDEETMLSFTKSLQGFNNNSTQQGNSVPTISPSDTATTENQNATGANSSG